MLLWTFALAALVAGAACGFVRRIAIRRQAVVPPRSDRWHREPTPTFGGVGIAAGAASVAIGAVVIGGVGEVGQFVAVLAAAVGLFGVGVVDDRLQLSPLAKLVWSLTIGAFLVYSLGAFQGPIAPAAQAVAVSAGIVWFGGVVHAFNLLDNMDGLAGGVGAIAGLFLVVVFGAELGPALSVLAVALVGALAGFLYWNRYPARLFMGDCGSLFTGAIAGGLSLACLAREPSEPALEMVLVALILIVPLFDTSFVLLLRRLAGRKASRGGTDHVSHRLVSLGLSERTAVLTLYGLAVAGGTMAWSLQQGEPGSAVPLAALFLVAVTLAGVYLARVPAYNGEDFVALQKTSFAPFLKDVTFRWHAAEILLDLILIAVVYYAAYLLRFEDERFETFIPSFTASLPVVMGCKLAALYVSGVYSRMWGTFGLRDLFTIVRGVALGSVLSILVAAYVYRFELFSRGVFVIDAALLTLAIVATRGSFRVMSEAASSRSTRSRRILVYGAGSGGQLLVREMRTNPHWLMQPIAFVDDDPVKFKRRILGVPVKGTFETLDDFLANHSVDELILSSFSINGTKEERVRELCAARGIPVRRLFLEIR
jgi:UDP-GlcNAc:undecaprenyl-phosphate GlcNAc-1-phosphate transferase